MKNKNKSMYNIRKKRKRQNKKIPLRQGGHRWNIYRVSNYILNGKKDNDVHGGLVIDEINDNVILVEVTHSSRWGKRNNQSIRNINSKDVDENGVLRKSYFKKRLIISKNGKAINISVLQKQNNDLNFSLEEIKGILNVINNLETTIEKYEEFIKLSKK